MKITGTNSQGLPLNQIKIKDKFWDPYLKLVKDVVIPYQWEVLNDRVKDADPSHAIKNLRIAAGMEQGEFKGFFFQDTDLAKWLEAVANELTDTPDPELEQLAEDAIDLLEKAQQPDGYLDSYFTTDEENKKLRFTNLEECHELYTQGHLIEAGVAYYQATGKDKFLKIVCKIADCIDHNFGPEDGKIHGYDGHQEIELALMRLYGVTREERYLKLAKYFLDQRGTQPLFFTQEWEKRDHISYWNKHQTSDPATRSSYYQAHEPIRQQKIAVGHAVREVYMLSGMASVAQASGDESLYQACKTLWKDIVTKQLYITGGIGSTSAGEAFTFDYDLPNDTVYSETCASIGLIGFAQKMLQINNEGCYADIIEQALFNVIIASMSRDGRHFFYVNPLEVWPEACEKSPIKSHVKAVRQKWFGCACCPPNLARLLTSLGKYIYTITENTVYAHQFISSEAQLMVKEKSVTILQSGNYPWDGVIQWCLKMEEALEFTFAIRIPGWCKNAEIKVNGKEIGLADLKMGCSSEIGEAIKIDERGSSIKNQVYKKDGYVYINRTFEPGTVIELDLEIPVRLIQANRNVRADAGKVAIMRGPVVYCLEEVENGANLSELVCYTSHQSEFAYEENFLDGAVIIHLDGYRRELGQQESGAVEEPLYQDYTDTRNEVKLTAIPYAMWGNRGSGEMLVWIRAGQ